MCCKLSVKPIFFIFSYLIRCGKPIAKLYILQVYLYVIEVKG